MSGAVRVSRGPAASLPIPATRPATRGSFSPRRLAAVVFSLVVLAILLVAWVHRDDSWISPQTGLGYQLGIIGSVMMLLLLLYPLRKRFVGLAWLGQVGDVFRIHMVLGIVGPLLVVMHSNFQLGSVNSNIALFAMLIVVASGIVGRYLYGRVHAGLYGSRSALDQLVANASAIVGHDVEEAPQVLAALTNYRFEALKPANLLGLLAFAFAAGRRRKDLTDLILAALDRQAAAKRWPDVAVKARKREAVRHLEQYFSATGKATAYGVYERLFAIWHLLHMPMFFLLILAAIAHIIAVHLY